MPAARPWTLAGLVVLAFTVQTTLLPMVGLTGVVPDAVLVVVVAVAVAQGPTYAAATGLGAGLLLDLAPPADHVVGRWALTLVVVGYLAGLVRQDAERSVVATCLVVASSSFVGTSLFALSGLLLDDPGATVSGAVALIPLAVLYDVLLGFAVVPCVRLWLTRLEPAAVRW